MNPSRRPTNLVGWFLGEWIVAIPTDAWGNEVRYRNDTSNGTHSIRVWSVGPDGIDGTSDDIVLEEQSVP